MMVSAEQSPSGLAGRWHGVFARLYDRRSRQLEGAGAAEHRRRLLEGAAGRVLEVGAGNGLNFAHYPKGVRQVVAVEPDPYLRRSAARAAAACEAPVELVDALAEELPFDDATFDVVVCSLVLCSVAPGPALAEVRRVLRPGGELRFYEHVASEAPGLARWQRRLDRPWGLVAGGCHLDRHTPEAIAAAGFSTERLEHFSFRPALSSVLTEPHVVGLARR